MATNNSQNLIIPLIAIIVGIIIGYMASAVLLPPKDGHEHKGTDIIIDPVLRSINRGGNDCCIDKSSTGSVTLQYPIRIKQNSVSPALSYAEIKLFDGNTLINPLDAFIKDISIIANNNDDLGPNGNNLVKIYKGNMANPYNQNQAFQDRLILEYKTGAFIPSYAPLTGNLFQDSGDFECELITTIKLEFTVPDNLAHTYVTEFFFPHQTDKDYDHHGTNIILNDQICEYTRGQVGKKN